MENDQKPIKLVNGNLPLGYIRRGGAVHIEEQGAAFVRDFFKTLLESNGQTLGKVFALVSKRHSIPVARSFSSRAARNKFYIGIIERDGEVFSHPYGTILEPELFYAVQEKFPPREKSADSVYRLTKAFKCGFRCDNYLIRELQKGNAYYRCHSKNHLPNSVTEKQLIHDLKEALTVLQFINIYRSGENQLLSIFDYIRYVCIKAADWVEHPDVDSVRALIDLVFTEITVFNKRCTFTYQEPFLSIAEAKYMNKLSFGFDTIKDIVRSLDEVSVGDESPAESILNLCKVAKSIDELATKLSMPQKEIRSLLFTLQLEKKIEDNGLGKYKTL